MAEVCNKARPYSQRLRYVNYLTALFLLVAGMKALTGECVTFFSDKLIHELHFTATQYASLSSLFYLSYGASTIVIGILTGRSPKRKAWLFPMTLAIGLISVLASFVRSYPGLAACRLATGVFTGSSQAIMLNIVSRNLVREDYGTRNGIINGGSTIISGTLGPVGLAFLAARYAWNASFFVIGAALIVLALLILFTVREVRCETNAAQPDQRPKSLPGSVSALFRNRIFVLCFVIGLLETTANLCLAVFMPLYFSEVMGFDTLRKGWFMSLRGMCYLPVGILIPLLADRFPVRYVMAGTFLCAVIAPAAAFALPGTMVSAYLLAIFGSWAGVTVTLFTYMIPRMTLPESLYMQGSGIILGVSVLLGGSLAPQMMSALLESGWRIEWLLAVCAALFTVCVLLSLSIKPLCMRESAIIKGGNA